MLLVVAAGCTGRARRESGDHRPLPACCLALAAPSLVATSTTVPVTTMQLRTTTALATTTAY